MGKARIEQDALRRRRFYGIDVGHDAYISDPLYGDLSGYLYSHVSSSSPPVMGESPVGLCHPMRVFLALHAGADVVLGVQDLHGHLVGGATHAAALDFQARPDVVEGVVQDLDRARARALFYEREGVVYYFLGGALLTVEHDLVDQLLHEHAPVHGIGGYLLLWWRCSPRHLLTSYDFLVPYLERPCLRLLTPSVSSAPRTTL